MRNLPFLIRSSRLHSPIFRHHTNHDRADSTHVAPQSKLFHHFSPRVDIKKSLPTSTPRSKRGTKPPLARLRGSKDNPSCSMPYSRSWRPYNQTNGSRVWMFSMRQLAACPLVLVKTETRKPGMKEKHPFLST